MFPPCPGPEISPARTSKSIRVIFVSRNGMFGGAPCFFHEGHLLFSRGRSHGPDFARWGGKEEKPVNRLDLAGHGKRPTKTGRGRASFMHFCIASFCLKSNADFSQSFGNGLIHLLFQHDPFNSLQDIPHESSRECQPHPEGKTPAVPDLI